MTVELRSFLIEIQTFCLSQSGGCWFPVFARWNLAHAQNRLDHWTSNVHDIEFWHFWVPLCSSKYPGVVNLPAELVPSHGALRRLGNKGLRSRTELLTFSNKQREEGKTDLAEFIVKERQGKTRLELRQDAYQHECTCNTYHEWHYCALQLLANNNIFVDNFVNCVKNLLTKRRGKFLCIVDDKSKKSRQGRKK